MGATSTNNGKQQVNIHPYQELTSLNANKLLYGIIEKGVYNCDISIDSDSSYINFRISEGTVFVFEKEIPLKGKIVGKIVLQEEAVIKKLKTTLQSYTTAEKLIVSASWTYDSNNLTDIFAELNVVPFSTGILEQIQSDNDLVLGIILNHQDFITDANALKYKVSYEEQKYRNVFKNLYEVAANFPIKFNSDGMGLSVGEGNCIIGDIYVYNKNTLTTTPPPPVDTLTPANYYQISALRLVTSSTLTPEDAPKLVWECFLKDIPIPSLPIKEIIDSFDFQWSDMGYTLLYHVRLRDGMEISPIWPEECFIVNPLIPQIGSPLNSSRLTLPVYNT
jgi:hypothetical protein